MADTTELLPAKPVDQDLIEQGIALVLRGLGQEGKAEVMENTPRRVAELYAQMINPPDVDVALPLKTFENTGVDDLIMATDVHYVSMCEHHLAPAFGVAHVGYVPNGRVVGYSKLKKALNYVARQPQLNERLLTDVRAFVVEALRPRFFALRLSSVHCCIAVRTNAPAQEVITLQAFWPDHADIDASGDNGEWLTWRSDFVRACDARKPLFLGQ